LPHEADELAEGQTTVPVEVVEFEILAQAPALLSARTNIV
jgi:hypothetical protein